MNVLKRNKNDMLLPQHIMHSLLEFHLEATIACLFFKDYNDMGQVLRYSLSIKKYVLESRKMMYFTIVCCHLKPKKYQSLALFKMDNKYLLSQIQKMNIIELQNSSTRMLNTK